MLPSISMETKLSARSRSRAFVSLVSRARFHELSNASTREPTSDEEEFCAAAAATPNHKQIATLRTVFKGRPPTQQWSLPTSQGPSIGPGQIARHHQIHDGHDHQNPPPIRLVARHG